MERIKIWVSEHPYLTGAFVIGAIVLILILRSRSSASGSVSAVAAGPSQAELAANVQSQQISAGAAAQQSQTAAQLALGMAQLQVQEDQISAAKNVALQQTLTGGETAQYSAQAQLAAAQAGYAASVANTATQASAATSIAGIQEQGAIQVASIGASRDISVAGIQADVSKVNIAAQLAGLEDTNKTSVALGQLSLTGLENTNAAKLAATVSTNQTAAEINAQNQQTQQLGITTQGTTDLASIAAQQEVNDRLINTSGGVAALQIQEQQNQLDTASGLIKSGVFNKGGEGGINQVTAFLGSIDSPAASTSAAAAGGVGVAQNTGGNTPGGILSGLGGLVKIGVSGLFGGAPAAAAVPSVTSTFTPGAPATASATV